MAKFNYLKKTKEIKHNNKNSNKVMSNNKINRIES